MSQIHICICICNPPSYPPAKIHKLNSLQANLVLAKVLGMYVFVSLANYPPECMEDLAYFNISTVLSSIKIKRCIDLHNATWDERNTVLLLVGLGWVGLGWDSPVGWGIERITVLLNTSVCIADSANSNANLGETRTDIEWHYWVSFRSKSIFQHFSDSYKSVSDFNRSWVTMEFCHPGTIQDWGLHTELRNVTDMAD